MKWQPIDTAPRLMHLIVTDGETVCQSFYGKVSHVPIFGWLNLFTDADDVQLLDWQPTHWMPLPEPPEEE